MVGRRRMSAIGMALLWAIGGSWADAAVRHVSHKKNSRPKVESRAPAKTGGTWQKQEERGATVAFTVLPGDTHAKLAADLTGENGNEGTLRRIDPSLKPGEKIRVPASILLPGLADTRLETVVFGGKYPTLWSVARQTQARAASEVGRTARNLQRLNAILNADHLSPGTKILVPKSWLEIAKPRPLAEPPFDSEESEATDEESPRGDAIPPEPVVAEEAGKDAGPPAEGPPALTQDPREMKPQPFSISRQYLVRDLDGLDRKSARLPSRLRQLLAEREYEQAHTGRGDISLVVVHTTEHRGSTFENTASYIRRKRLANYVIGPTGAAYEVVPEGYRAYGCGDSVWGGKYYVDLEAINIEVFANTEKGPHQGTISDAQYEGLRALLADIRARRPKIDEGRVVTHRMVALNFKTGMRSRKGDPFEFDWAKAGLPDNSTVADRDLLDGRAKICTDCRFTDRITAGQTEALKALKKL